MRRMYSHTQVAWWAPVVGLALAGTITWRTGAWNAGGPVLLVMLAAWTLFGTLTVTVDREALTCRFGPIGLIRKRLRLGDIRGASAIRTSPVWGWGIRWTPRGWLWNVWGLDAVEVQLANGRRFLVGTDEPLALVDALRRAGATS